MKQKIKKIIEHLTIYSRELLIISLSVLLLIYVLGSYSNSVELKVKDKKIKELTKVVDSLNTIKLDLETEKFILETELTRHEITRTEIFSLYPKVGQEYDYYISHYTE